MNTSNTATAAVQLNFKVTPRRPALLSGFDNTVDILVQIEGPEEPVDKPHSTPLNLALVLDRSGSMQGEPLAEAIRCAKFIIENLRDTDRLALVIYDNKVDVLVPNTKLLNKKLYLDALDTVYSGGNTDLHAGWLQGAQETAGFVAAHRVSRVLLLSDGQANHGLTDSATIATQCEQLANTGVSTSTYGLGYQFNEDLMVRMAQAGCGNAYYGETAADLIEPFQREFDLLSALCARQVHLHIQPRPGVDMTVLNPYSKKQGGFILPDIAFGGVAWAIVRLKVPAVLTGIGDGSMQSLAEVMVSANDMNGQALNLSSSVLELSSLPPQAWQSVSEDELVCRRIGELEASSIQKEARSAAWQGDWDTVHRLLDEARSKAPDNPWVSAVLDTLETLAGQEDLSRFSKESIYSSRSMDSRLLARKAEYDLELESMSSSYLRRKHYQGKIDSIAPSQADTNNKVSGESIQSSNPTQQTSVNSSSRNRIPRWLKAIINAVVYKYN